MLSYGYYEAIKGHTETSNHTLHCFAYLRQSIMCAADTALEPYREEHSGADGYESPHQCRDYNAVFAWAERFRYSDSHGI